MYKKCHQSTVKSHKKALSLVFSTLVLMTPQSAKVLPLKTLKGSEQILRLVPCEENLEESEHAKFMFVKITDIETL